MAFRQKPENPRKVKMEHGRSLSRSSRFLGYKLKKHIGLRRTVISCLWISLDEFLIRGSFKNERSLRVTIHTLDARGPQGQIFQVGQKTEGLIFQ
uniref:Uncharacterized protein n=1 Tax=Romanomermis culicivorax TaxID=13658 RepID=A0A915J7G0_ROMCU